MPQPDATRVVIVGGGVVGLCCALTLLREGYRVSLIERDASGESATAASCGSLAVSEIIPLSRPGILRRAPGWFFSPDGPMSIRAASLPRLLPWFLRFAGNARAERIARISLGLSQLTATALEDWLALLKPLQLDAMIRSRPVLELYDSETELAAERGYHARRRELGFDIEEISGQQAVDLEPAIAADFARAVIYGDWRSITDGAGLLIALTRAFSAAGGELIRAEVIGFETRNGRIEGVNTTPGRVHPADQVVLAAGAWSRRFAPCIGRDLPLEGVIGYQTTIAEPGFDMAHAVIYARGGFGVTPYESGLAIGGTIEFASLDAKPDWRRAELLMRRVRRVLPGLKNFAGVRRIGRRPMTPDTLPIIDRAPATANLLLATGHGQLGVTSAATTGRLIAAMVAQRIAPIDLQPYRLDRF